jgi:hypothetical protein
MTGQDKSVRLLTTYNQSFFEKIDFVAGVQYDYADIIPAYANDHVYRQPLKFTGDVKKKISDTLQINEQKLGIFSQIRVNFSKKYILLRELATRCQKYLTRHLFRVLRWLLSLYQV